MEPEQDPVEALAQRVREGDYEAKEQLRRHFKSALVPMARCVLRRGTALSAKEQNVLAAAERLGPWARHASTDEQAASVADILCDTAINRLWPGRTEELCPATLCA
jgi:hypothetical protein